VENLLEATLKEFGKVDVVVNNAGTTYPKKASHTVTEEEYDKVITVNQKSIFLSVAVIVPYSSAESWDDSEYQLCRRHSSQERLVSLSHTVGRQARLTVLDLVWCNESICE